MFSLFSQKHYVANSVDNTRINKSVTVDGQHYSAGDLVTRHTTDVTISNAQLQEYLAAFRAAAKAGAKGMMCSYNSVAGIPTCLSPMLKKARELWTGQTPWGETKKRNETAAVFSLSPKLCCVIVLSLSW